MECLNVSSAIRLDACGGAASLSRRELRRGLSGSGGGFWSCPKRRGREEGFSAAAAASSSPAAAPVAAEKGDVNRVGSLSQVSGVLGCQWGDEGKGKLVDILAKHFDVVARCQPDFKAIKRRIEDLIMREYLEREEENPNVFRYLA